MLDATPPVTTRQVSVAEAAREFGISPETVRRWIKSGRLEARRAIRPQGAVWEVSLPVTTPRGVLPVIPVTGHSEVSPLELGQAPPDEAGHPSPSLVHHIGDAATLAASIARLIVELAEVRVISDRRADQLISQAETIGQLRAELATARAPQSPPGASGTPEPPEPPTEPAPGPDPFPTPLPPHPNATPWWHRWRAWLVAGLVVAVVGLASCQVPAPAKHAGMCQMARTNMDLLGARPIEAERLLGGDCWLWVEAMVETAAKTC